MPSSTDNPSSRSALIKRFGRLFTSEEPADEAARAALEHIDKLNSRIDAVREDVHRGIRRKEGRFRL